MTKTSLKKKKIMRLIFETNVLQKYGMMSDRCRQTFLKLFFVYEQTAKHVLTNRQVEHEPEE